MDEKIAFIPKNKTEQNRISLSEYKGCNLIDIRIYWHKSDDEVIPIKKGISLNVDKLDELIAGLEKARQQIKSNGATYD